MNSPQYSEIAQIIAQIEREKKLGKSLLGKLTSILPLFQHAPVSLEHCLSILYAGKQEKAALNSYSKLRQYINVSLRPYRISLDVDMFRKLPAAQRTTFFTSLHSTANDIREHQSYPAIDRINPIVPEYAALTQQEFNTLEATAPAERPVEIIRKQRTYKLPVCPVEGDVATVSMEEIKALAAKNISNAEDSYARLSERKQSGITFLKKWFTDEKASPFAAVLGETGAGKTTLLQMLARDINQNLTLPPAIYVDLKNYVEKDKFTLEGILEEHLRQSSLASPSTLTPADLIHAVQKEGALIIFDGLDEKIIPLTDQGRQSFIRELWRIMPSDVIEHSSKEGRGRLIVSCRSSYFPDVQTQETGYLGGNRSFVKPQDHTLCIMLPWSDEMIRTYLSNIVGEEKVDETIKLIHSIHNLRDLSRRPMLLHLISGELYSLEAAQLRGEKINAASLYHNLVTSWLSRDDDKHLFTKEHKRLMMEQLAADLWRDEAREWTWDKVADWLDEFLLINPKISQHYQSPSVSPSAKNQDFRTATFFLRPDSSEKSFRFAHTSLQEYFLACHLVKGLQGDGVAEIWDLPKPSDETFDFVGQLLEKLSARDLQKALEGMRKMLGTAEFPENARRNAFLYHLRIWHASNGQGRLSEPSDGVDARNEKNGRFQGNTTLSKADVSEKRPCLLRPDLCMRGMDWGGLKIIGTEENPIHLGKVDFSYCFIGDSTFEYVHFADGADFRNTGNGYVKMICCTVREADFTGTELSCLSLERCNKRGIIAPQKLVRDYSLPQNIIPSHISAMIAAGHSNAVTSAAFSPNGKRIISSSYDNTLKLWDAASGECLHTFTGHSNRVTSAVFSPDGKRIISSSEDNTLKLWDMISGNCLHTFTGHSNTVTSAAFSPDGKRIISASEDNTLKLWDMISGNCLHTFTGHSEAVTTAAFRPDGKRIISSSEDNTLKLWDADSGKCLHTFTGHSYTVTSAAFSPDGKRIISASWDNTLKLWDAASGECLHTFTGHSNFITSAAFSPDGKRIISASWDKSLKLWVTASGECLHAFAGHSDSVWSAAFSPDGKRIISASWDKSLKLWDAASGDCLHTFTGHSNFVTTAAFSPDGKRIIYASDDNTLKLWDAASGECLHPFTGHSNTVTSAAFSSDGKRIISASDDKSLKLWDTASGECLRNFTGHSDWVSSVAFSPDGKWIVSMSLFGEKLCHSSENGEQIAVPADAKVWLEKNIMLTPISTNSMKDGKRLFFVRDNNSTIILEPWDEDEAKKPEHEIRWKIKSGPKDYWRYVHAIDRETGEIYDADYALADDFVVIE